MLQDKIWLLYSIYAKHFSFFEVYKMVNRYSVIWLLALATLAAPSSTNVLNIWIRNINSFFFQAMYASVIPGEYMRGSMGGMIQFPQWLGKNSTTNKQDRILQELRSHMALK